MFIISGMGRGGTSIIACMLREHSQIDLMFENSDVCRTPQKKYQEMEIENFCKGIITADKILEGSLFWKERYPERLIKWYHNTKFLFIYRDGRDMIASLNPISSSAVLDTVMKWNDYVNRSQAFIKKHPHICYVLRYTDFILRTEHYLNGICNFLNIPYSDKMFNFTMEVAEYKRKYGNKVDKTRIHLWKAITLRMNTGTYKYTDLLQKAEENMKPNLLKLGYEI